MGLDLKPEKTRDYQVIGWFEVTIRAHNAREATKWAKQHISLEDGDLKLMYMRTRKEKT